MKAEPRRPVPMRLQRDVALAQLAVALSKLGLVPVEHAISWELDHAPALARRDVDPETGQHVPHQHDVNYLVWMPKAEHAVKTRGSGATTRGSDIGEVAHERRLTKKEAEFRKRLLDREAGQQRPRRGKIKPAVRRPATPQRTATRPLTKRPPGIAGGTRIAAVPEAEITAAPVANGVISQ